MTLAINLSESTLSIIGVIAGGIGAVTGLISLGVSIFTYRYNIPDIKITELELQYPDHMVQLAGQTVEQLKNHYLEFELSVVVKNKRGGSGSIDKPILLLRTPKDKIFGIYQRYSFIKMNPTITSTDYIKKSENITSIITNNLGSSFNVAGGETINDVLSYETTKKKII